MHLAPLLLTLAACQQPPMTEPPADRPQEHTNALARETSPYLLQHATNPVDWLPWGPEALALAKRLDKPVFLSIGYSACHWCHVMEHESFEDERIAALLNERFVCIKVDREERPDVDDIYMSAVQAMTGSGGWPLSVFLTPDLEPFYGGTYFPPTSRLGRPGFDDVVTSLGRAWAEDREKVLEQAGRLTAHLEQLAAGSAQVALREDLLDRSLASLQERFDPDWGGFGAAPKFPHASDLLLTLRHAHRTGDPEVLAMATTTLDRMAEGGIFDQLAGGFARYSTDERWLIPHFEKMLYDNALLVPAYLEAHALTGEPRHAEVARRTLDWVLAEMTTPEGGFASSLDADSEGEEGTFYVWDRDELRAALGDELGHLAADWFGVTDEGSFEHGKSALWRNPPADEVAADHGLTVAEAEERMESVRARLLELREQRERPGRDDKVLTSWNGLMISAMARGSWALDEPRYLAAARGAADLVLTGMRQEDGRLFPTSRAGRAHLNAYLDDYAFLIAGLLDLYEADFDPRWIREALALARIVEDEFAAEDGGYFTTGDTHEELLVRMRSSQDGAMPSGLGVHALSLVRLAQLTGEDTHAVRAEEVLASIGGLANRFPAAFGSALIALDLTRSSPRQVVLAGELDDPATAALLAVVRRGFRPHVVVALADSSANAELMPLVQGKAPGADAPLAYVCRDSTCKAPVATPETLEAELSTP